MNLAEFLSDGDRIKLVLDFPYVFKNHIGIVLSEGITLGAEKLDRLTKIKTKFSDNDVNILEEPDVQFDLIILGTLPLKANWLNGKIHLALNFMESIPTSTKMQETRLEPLLK